MKPNTVTLDFLFKSFLSFRQVIDFPASKVLPTPPENSSGYPLHSIHTFLRRISFTRLVRFIHFTCFINFNCFIDIASLVSQVSLHFFIFHKIHLSRHFHFHFGLTSLNILLLLPLSAPQTTPSVTPFTCFIRFTC